MFCLFIAGAFGSITMGLLNAWTSYTSELYLSNSTPLSNPITKGEEALLGSLPSLGAMVGSGIVGIIINRLGRRYGGVIVYLPILVRTRLSDFFIILLELIFPQHFCSQRQFGTLTTKVLRKFRYGLLLIQWLSIKK